MLKGLARGQLDYQEEAESIDLTLKEIVRLNYTSDSYVHYMMWL